MADATKIETAIAALLPRCTLRAPSLIVTILGDAIAPHGGSFWIGSLITLLAPFGVNERLVRTATFRLTKEDWLSATQIGRRSYYSLTASGLRRFEQAFHRVYESSPQAWDGSWSLALVDPAGLDAETRDRVRQELSWAGFGMAAPSVFAHTALPATEIRRLIDGLGISDRTVVMSARLDLTNPSNHDGSAAAFVHRCWDLDRLATDYREFLDLFRPLWQVLRSESGISPEHAFVARTALIHEYRRITLRDPQLPAALHSPEWEGTAARLLTRNLYRALEAQAEAYIMAEVETADGPLPEAAFYYADRFGGLR
ncbi:phenylacetic acid degradation operon negative regulatory protein PaaX [Govanella unica]|uniref:Phenylacetic acid degradation operon negative regulatory protein PaaX n=1 Tax=Govanella unica TaxID=2975056 RepID=A0A9X3TXZ0_9PROT|nr:phenylacetic acid degradation operon negative regulatory protein PaaX [Govania unica]MDA5193417.1 phenylacetic acid degradation operon negative regulatory protein PaaX [Govania unica]